MVNVDGESNPRYYCVKCYDLLTGTAGGAALTYTLKCFLCYRSISPHDYASMTYSNIGEEVHLCGRCVVDNEYPDPDEVRRLIKKPGPEKQV